MNVKKTTPLLVVDHIEPSLPFWESLGWTKVAEVPHEGALGFVMFVGEGGELMLQTRASVAADLGDLSVSCALYLDVDSIDEAVASATGARILIRDRKTFYGSREAWVLDPAGHLIGFCEKG